MLCPPVHKERYAMVMQNVVHVSYVVHIERSEDSSKRKRRVYQQRERGDVDGGERNISWKLITRSSPILFLISIFITLRYYYDRKSTA